MTTTAPWASLTPLERDALVAEKFMGWTDFWEGQGYLMAYPPTEQAMGIEAERAPVPRYTTDRAAALCVEDEIERRNLQDAYLEALASIAGPLLLFDAQIWAMLRATPEQRCHAALIAAEVHDE